MAYCKAIRVTQVYRNEEDKRMRHFYMTLLIVGAVLASACQTAPEAEKPTPSPKRVLEKMAPQEYVKRGVAYLAMGDRENARLYLSQALVVEPGNKRARMLLEHLDADPQQVLGREFKTYQVRRGQTLVDIAQRYLGDPLKFYILARYNGIANPSRLETGQVIRLPGRAGPVEPLEPKALARTDQPARPAEPPPAGSKTVPAAALPPEPARPPEPAVGREEPLAGPSAAPAESPPVKPTEFPPQTAAVERAPAPAAPPAVQPPPALSDYDKARQFYEAGNYRGAIALLENAAPADERSRELLVSSYVAQADTWQNSGDLTKARAGLRQALRVQPSNASIQQRLDSLEGEASRRDSDRLYRQGVSERQAGQLETAYATLAKVPSGDPNYAQAQQQRAGIRSTLVDGYHKQALLAYKQQDMCKAIGLWDKVLELDPSHAPASGNRARARAIVQKLGQSCP